MYIISICSKEPSKYILIPPTPNLISSSHTSAHQSVFHIHDFEIIASNPKFKEKFMAPILFFLAPKPVVTNLFLKG